MVTSETSGVRSKLHRYLNSLTSVNTGNNKNKIKKKLFTFSSCIHSRLCWFKRNIWLVTLFQRSIYWRFALSDATDLGGSTMRLHWTLFEGKIGLPSTSPHLTPPLDETHVEIENVVWIGKLLAARERERAMTVLMALRLDKAVSGRVLVVQIRGDNWTTDCCELLFCVCVLVRFYFWRKIGLICFK